MSAGLLQPRFRRVLSIGALLDESIQLYRQYWQTFAIFGAVALAPGWLLLMLAQLLGAAPNGRATLELVPGIIYFTAVLVGTILSLVWSIAASMVAAELIVGNEPTLGPIYRRVAGRLLPVLGAALLISLRVLGLTIAALVPFVVSVFGAVGVPLAAGLLIYWWQRPAGRRPWLKWLIILSAPFGLVTYYSVRWALFLPALVVESLGALGSVRRSSQVVDHHWFRTFAVLTITSLILAVLISVPVSIAQVLVVIVDPNGLVDGSLSSSIVVNTVSTLCQLFFSSIGAIAYVLLFIDLRNRREGTDLLERVQSLEATPA